VATPREQLIADWRRRLAAASDAPREPTSRAAWLTRLRLRLYRFLLALYGEGHWNAPKVTTIGSAVASADIAVIDSPDVLPLAGKPAKSEEQIRAALKSVADAQDQPIGLGPLEAGLDPYDWVAVASSSGHVQTAKFLQLLRQAGFAARIALRGDDRFVEVYAINYDEALALLNSRRDEVRGRDHIGQFEGIHFLVGVTLVAIFSPFLILALFVGLSLNPNPDIAVSLDSARLMILFFAGWGACVFAYCCFAAIRAIWLLFPRWKQHMMRRVLGVHSNRKR
jgi:hypothetical protein